jgi:hypothetical protein
VRSKASKGLSEPVESYSGFTIATPRRLSTPVAFSSRKCHFAQRWKGHMNCGTALIGPKWPQVPDWPELANR